MKKTYMCCILLLMAVAASARQALPADLILHTATGDLHGTLQLPPGSKPAVVLIIAGSGPTDRNGNNPSMINNSLKMLADSLQAHGYASLRYDKRGIGASKSAGGPERALRFEHYIQDATAWVRKLQADGRFSKVFILGHSEGSLIGMVAASQSKPDGFISVAGAGFPADQLLKQQIAVQAPQLADTCNRIIDSLKAGHTINSVNPMLYSLFRPDVQPYMISWFRYDPRSELSGLSCPVLLIQGSTDIQTDVAGAEALAAANKKAELRLIPGMNHILKDAPADRQQNMATYGNPDLPLNPEFINALTGFLARVP